MSLETSLVLSAPFWDADEHTSDDDATVLGQNRPRGSARERSTHVTEATSDIGSRLTRIIFDDDLCSVDEFSYPHIPLLNPPPCQSTLQIAPMLDKPGQLDLVELNKLLGKHVDETEIDQKHTECAQNFFDLANQVSDTNKNLEIEPDDHSTKHRFEIAIMLGREAYRLATIGSTASPKLLCEILLSLAANLRRRYRCSSASPDIEEAILFTGEALQLCKPDSSHRAEGLRLLAKCLRSHRCQTNAEDGVWSMSSDHYLHRTLRFEEVAELIQPLERFDLSQKLHPDIEGDSKDGLPCEIVESVRLLVLHHWRNLEDKLACLLEDHSQNLGIAPQSHRFCAICLAQIADELRDLLEDDSDYPNPSSIISIEEQAYKVARAVRYGQGRAASQLAASLYRRDEAEEEWTQSTDLERATEYAMQALYLGYNCLHTMKILENIYYSWYKRSQLELDRDNYERFHCDRLCLSNVKAGVSTTSNHSGLSKFLRDAPVVPVCPVAKAHQGENTEHWNNDKWFCLVRMHANDRSHYEQVPYECARALCRLVNYLDPASHSKELICLVIDEGLACIPATHYPQRIELLKESATALLSRSSHFDTLDDLDAAIQYCTEAVDLYDLNGGRMTIGDPPHYQLAVLHLKRYLHSNQALGDLQRTIDLAYSSLTVLGKHETGVLSTRSQMILCKALRLKFTATGSRSELDESVKFARTAYSTQGDLFQASIGGLKLQTMEQLILSLYYRGFSGGDSDDLLEAISLIRIALKIQQDSLLLLRCYSSVLQALPIDLIRQSYLDEAIDRLRSHSENIKAQLELVRLLFHRHRLSFSRPDLDEAIQLVQTLSERETDGSTNSLRYVGLRASLLVERCKTTGDIRDADLAYSAVQAIMHVLSTLASRGKTVMSPGYTVLHRRSGLPPRLCIRASRAIGDRASTRCYCRPATLKQSVRSRLENIKRLATGVAGDAAACAVANGQYEKAIELLEHGRSIFWQQALQLRTDLNELERSHPELARELVDTQTELESSGYLERLGGVGLATNQMFDAESITQNQRIPAEKFESLVGSVRAVPGYKDFMRPKPFSYLRKVLLGHTGTLVVLNLSRTFDRCDALIFRPDGGLKHIHLDKLSPTQVSELAKQHLRFVSSSQRSASRSAEDGIERGVVTTSPKSGMSLEQILRSLWTDIVQPTITHIGVQSNQKAPLRLWWLPTDSFNGLPLHAAGIYSEHEQTCLSDFAVSSYLPTLTSLTSRASQSGTSLRTQILVISQPATPGFAPIPATTLEGKHICATAPVPVKVLDHTDATVKQFLEALPISDIVHAACHGTHDSTDPMKSAIMLYDGPVPVSRIMRTPLLKARIAFLSACETAMGDNNLPDEVLHLSAAFVFAGFRSVVGTMWSIQDKDGPLVARRFYEHIAQQIKDRGLENIDSSRALHYAIIELRKSGAEFLRWVPFIHMGD